MAKNKVNTSVGPVYGQQEFKCTNGKISGGTGEKMGLTPVLLSSRSDSFNGIY